MNLYTEIDLKQDKAPLEHDSKLFLIGSCFSDNISRKLARGGIQHLSNPFGVVFNPYSILDQLKKLMNNEKVAEREIRFHDGVFKSLKHHSQFNSTDKQSLIEAIEKSSAGAYQMLEQANLVIITLGSSWVYEHQELGIVANCHKIPQVEFKKRMLSLDELERILGQLLELLTKFNSSTRVVFTLSPVRHLKDGYKENARSKAVLLEAIHRRIDKEKVQYFPAFEVVMDQLRDYRFYEDDMLHPNSLAIDLIWEKFSKVYFSNDCRSLISEVNDFFSKKAHRTMFPESESARIFDEKLKEEEAALRSKIPYLTL